MSSPSPPAGQLLFAVLAMNTNFVNRKQFLDALTDWTSQPQTPLPELLAVRANLDDDERLTLGRLLNKCAKRNGGAQKALEALLDPYLRLDLDSVLGGEKSSNPFATLPPAAQASDPFATLPPGSKVTIPTVPPPAPPAAPRPAATAAPAPPRPAATAAPAPPPVAPRPAATAAPAPPPPPQVRYRRLAPHARDGLGETSVAHDEELNREVILREINSRHANDERLRARFLREAEITGHLEHPGVVPVYGLGFYSDGRPYYAMRFVKGGSLSNVIEHFHAPDGPRRDPLVYLKALRQLLARFLDVCDTIAYAHSRGIIHRDLKPSNVTLGEFGETMVVDWSLARPYDRPDRYAMTASMYVRSNSDSSQAEPGRIVGTPAYLSPEQAQGFEVGPVSDVYLLGGVLYEILTGVAPHSGADSPDERLELARRGQVTPARRREPKVPPALEAICARALAPQPKDRYPSARELAEEIERFLADEPVEVYTEPLPDRLGRWVQRNRFLAAAGVALLCLAILVLCVLLVVVAWGRNRSDAAEQEPSNAHRDSVALRGDRRDALCRDG